MFPEYPPRHEYPPDETGGPCEWCEGVEPEDQGWIAVTSPDVSGLDGRWFCSLECLIAAL